MNTEKKRQMEVVLTINQNDFNQFSFSQYDKENDWENYNNKPIKYEGKKFSIVMSSGLFPNMPYYDTQLEMIAEAYLDLLKKLNLKYSIELDIAYDYYGNIRLVWTGNKKNLKDIILTHQNIIDGDFAESMIMEDLLMNYHYITNWDDDGEDWKNYITSLHSLGYEIDTEEFEGIVDMSEVKTFISTLK